MLPQLRSPRIQACIKTAPLGLAVAFILVAMDGIRKAASLKSIRWFFLQEQPTPTLVAWDTFLILLGVALLPFLRETIARIRRTHELPSRPATFLHAATIGGIGLLFGLLLLDGESSRRALVLLLTPSQVLSSHLPLWAVFFSTIAILAPLNVPQRESRTKPDASTLTDDPITEESEDILGRRTLVDRLYQQLRSLPKPCTRFVLALDGRWGDGKTSVLNLLGNRLLADESVILVKFNAWLHDDDRSTLRGFFGALEGAITARYFYPSFRKLLGRYAETIGGTKKRLLDFALNAEDPDGIESTRNAIENCIKALGKQIVVFIDDVDRLEYPRLISIFRLVNLLADFQDIVFILCIDRVQVDLTLKKHGRDDSFIEKIFQRIEPLPQVSRRILDDFIQKELDSQLSAINTTQSERSDLDRRAGVLYQKSLRFLFTNLRSAKSLVNGLAARLPLLRGEINVTDLFLLEILRSRFPTLHDDLWPHRWLYVNPGWSRARRDLALGLIGSAERPEKAKHTVDHINGLLETYADKATARELLEALFPEVTNAFAVGGRHHLLEREMRDNKRLCHPDCLRKVFEQSVEEAELPDADIDALQAKWLATTGETRKKAVFDDIEALHKNKLLSPFIERMIDRAERIAADLAPPIILALANISINLTEEETLPFTSELRQARNLAVLLLRRLSAQDIRSTVQAAISSSSAIDFAAGIVSLVTRQDEREAGFENVYEAVDSKQATEALARRLEHRYLTGKADIFSDPSAKAPIWILSCWSGLCARRSDVMQYVEAMGTDNPSFIVALLRPFYHGLDRAFEFKSLTSVFDPGRIAALAAKSKGKVDDDSKTIIYAFTQAYERAETARFKVILTELTPFEHSLLKSLIGKDYERVDNANDLHIERLVKEGLVEKIPFTGEIMLLPEKQFAVRLTERGKQLASMLT